MRLGEALQIHDECPDDDGQFNEQKGKKDKDKEKKVKAAKRPNKAHKALGDVEQAADNLDKDFAAFELPYVKMLLQDVVELSQALRQLE